MEILKILGLGPTCGNHPIVNKRIKEEKFDLTKFKENKEIAKRNHLKKWRIVLSDEEIFCVNSNADRNRTKQRLIQLGMEYKCVELSIGLGGLFYCRYMVLLL